MTLRDDPASISPRAFERVEGLRMYAIVATGGKQIKVAAGDVVVVEKLDAAVGESVTFDVIFLADGDQITVDSSVLADATVKGEVVEQFKGEKAIVFKFK